MKIKLTIWDQDSCTQILFLMQGFYSFYCFRMTFIRSFFS
uniref:Uncharacterized protein n=1 Tax=Anguilla anguilla TaxID=7936 RepID=A0A0E9TCD8_ANGAN